MAEADLKFTWCLLELPKFTLDHVCEIVRVQHCRASNFFSCISLVPHCYNLCNMMRDDLKKKKKKSLQSVVHILYCVKFENLLDVGHDLEEVLC